MSPLFRPDCAIRRPQITCCIAAAIPVRTGHTGKSYWSPQQIRTTKPILPTDEQRNRPSATVYVTGDSPKPPICGGAAGGRHHGSGQETKRFQFWRRSRWGTCTVGGSRLHSGNHFAAVRLSTLRHPHCHICPTRSALQPLDRPLCRELLPFTDSTWLAGDGVSR